MKKILLVLLVLIPLFAEAQIIDIPDVNFKNALVNSNCIDSDGDNSFDSDADTNNDGEIQLSEALVVTKLNLNYRGITDLTGINNFINLVYLNCTSNVNLTTVSISNLSSLEILDLGGNLELTNLNLSNLNSLNSLDCAWTNIGTLDLTNLMNLKKFNCYAGQLTSLNIANLSNLEELNLVGCDLNSIDFSGVSNLKKLLCSQNQLINLNLSSLTVLEELQCNDNLLSSLDLSNNVLIKNVNCSNNNLISINLTGLVNLESLNFSNNQMAAVSLGGLTALQNLHCDNNQFTSLNLNGLAALVSLSCGDNQLTNLDFSGLLNLRGVLCWNNQLTQLDFSENPLFGDLLCSNNLLNYINIKNGTNHFNTDNVWSDNPTLQFICVDEDELSIIQSIVDQSENINPSLTTYCSFIPGGNYNVISGIVKFDAGNDGCNAADLPQSSIKIKINDGLVEGASLTNTNAEYLFHVQNGNFTMTPDVENPSWFNFSPPNTAINFPNNNNNSVVQNFCMTANGVHPDLEIVIAPVLLARPGFDAFYKVVYKNKGNQMLSGNVMLNFNDTVLDLVSSVPSPDLQTTGQYTFNFANLLPFEQREIAIVFNVNSSVETPAVNSGDVLNFTVLVNPTASDETPADNQFVYNQIVVNACDPNDKICLEGNVESPTKIGDYLHYIINFENVGTASAVNVVVKDVIDANKFDEESIQVLNSSHPVETKIKGNNVEFVFKNINLAAPVNGGETGGRGNVVFKIKTKDNLVSGDEVANKADIFFDYNAPITTNFATTVFQTLDLDDVAWDNSVKVYPNPTRNSVNIKSARMIKSIQLFDVQGRLLLNKITNQTDDVLELQTKPSGLYFVKVFTEDGLKIEKVIKE
ncbi:DUF7619 domain-containing protein [Flavobacterium sp. GCM10027622]|uniref:DUF7619 domain-containing protein n=1 Tax=unclassified Flavobacterium TaxID=196869 RepID=UPI00361402B4